MMKLMKYLVLAVVGAVFLSGGWVEEGSSTMIDHALVPEYVTNGLKEYETRGYEAAVQAWLVDSPYRNATTVVSSISFFKNIEMLAGKYKSYDILMTKETQSSNVVYVRMNYERLPGFILFTSLKGPKGWVLGKINLDRMQRFGAQ